MISQQLAVSSWSLHRALDRGDFTLLELPALAVAHGIGKLEICHFHFASTDSAYLADLRGALDAAKVAFFTLLIDTGDLTHPDPIQRRADLDTMIHWVEIAAVCGAQRARVIGGDTLPDPNGDALRLSASGLRELAGAANGAVRIVTENWHPLLDRPEELLALLEMMEGQLGLLLDFGNWKGDRKYDDLAKIAPFAESTHAKADFPAAGEMNAEDFTRCLEICRAAGFHGPHSLIFDGPGDEWKSLDQIQEAVRPYLTA